MIKLPSAKSARLADHLMQCLMGADAQPGTERLAARASVVPGGRACEPAAFFKALGRFILLTAVLTAIWQWGATSTARGAAEDCPDNGPMHPDCGQHNMMIVGEQTIFLSHLPMFHGEHRFQVIVEAGFAADGISLDRVYADDRQKNPTVKMYTLRPEAIFVLPRLFSGDPETLLGSFPGTIFRGHLERGGRELAQLSHIEVNVKRVIYAEEIGRHADRTGSDELTYILFGGPSELFLAHSIAQPPDFDQLLGVTVAGHQFTEEELARGVAVTVPDRPNAPTQRLRAGETTDARGHVTGALTFLPLEVNVTAEYYFEEGELTGAQTAEAFEPTPLEIEAGF